MKTVPVEVRIWLPDEEGEGSVLRLRGILEGLEIDNNIEAETYDPVLAPLLIPGPRTAVVRMITTNWKMKRGRPG